MSCQHQQSKLIQFLQKELEVSPAAIAVLLRHREQEFAPWPMLLWKYGMVSVEQLAQIFDWLESQYDY